MYIHGNQNQLKTRNMYILHVYFPLDCFWFFAINKIFEKSLSSHTGAGFFTEFHDYRLKTTLFRVWWISPFLALTQFDELLLNFATESMGLGYDAKIHNQIKSRLIL